MNICGLFFERAEVGIDGEVYPCCQARRTQNSIGNILKQSFEEIWNSENLKKLRNDAKNGKYPAFCNPAECSECEFISADKYTTDSIPYPKIISFSFDEECNSKCVFCRDEIRPNNENIENLRKRINDFYLPMCRDAHCIHLNTVGEVFASKFCQEFIRMAAEKYPHIVFDILTNGISASEESITKIGLTNRIKEIVISINAATAKTHNRIFRNNGYKVLLKNLDYLLSLKKQNKIKVITFNFVVCSYNWKEMKQFIKFAEKYEAQVYFWEVRNYCGDMLEHKYEDLAVHLPESKEYSEFKKYLTSVEFENKNIRLFPVLQSIRNEGLLEKKSNRFIAFLNKFKQ